MRRFWIAQACVSVVLSVGLTWPAVLHVNTHVIGHPAADGIKHLWTLWWIRQEILGEGSFPFHTELVNFPVGMELYPIEPLNGLLAVLLGWLPIVTTTNLAALANLTLDGVLGARLGHRLGGGHLGALAAGITLQCSSIALFTLHVGVGELQHLWFLPLGALCWIELREGLSLAAAAKLAAAMAAATLSCFYHGFFLALTIALLSLLTLVPSARLLGLYTVAALGGLAVVWPVTRTFSGSYQGGEEPPRVGLVEYVRGNHGQPTTDPVSARLDPSQLYIPENHLRESASMELSAYGGGRYVGVPTLLLLAVALAVAPRKALPWWAVAITGVLFAMGSKLVWGAVEFSDELGRAWVLPFTWLNRALGYIGEPLNFPVRFLAMTATALAACAGIAGRHKRGGQLALGLSVIGAVDVQLHQLQGRPMASFEAWTYPELAALGEGASEGMVDLSLAWRADKEVRWASLSAQMAHGQRLSGVPLERIEYFATDGRLFVSALPLTQDLQAGFAYSEVEVSQDYRADKALMRDAGFTRVLVLGVGQDRRVPPTIVRALTKILGSPEVEAWHVAVWRIPEVQTSPEELATWKAEQAARVEGLRRSGVGQAGPQLR